MKFFKMYIALIIVLILMLLFTGLDMKKRLPAFVPFSGEPDIEWQYGSNDGRDAYIYGRTGYEDNNYGSQAHLAVRPYSVNGKFRSLIRFDSLKYSMDTVTYSQVIDSSFLSFVIKDRQVSADTLFITSISSFWNESSVSWDSARSGIPWSTPGGDFAGPPYIDTVLVGSLSIGDTLRFNVTGSVDSMINGGAPNNGWIILAGNEAVTSAEYLVEVYSSDHNIPGDRPKLEIFYSDMNKPHSVSADSQFYNGVIVSGIDILGGKSYKAVFSDTGSGIFGDTVITNGINPDTLCDTLYFAGYYDSLLQITLTVWDTNGNSYESEDKAEFHTCAQKITTVTATDTTDSTITFFFGPDSNPSTVEYQLYNSSTSSFFDTSGKTVSPDSSWFRKTDWGTVQIETNVNSLQMISINSRNSDKLESGLVLNDSVWSWAQVPGIDTVYALNKDTILLIIDPKLNPAYTYFAVEDSLTGLFIDLAAHNFRSSIMKADSSWAWGTYTEWGDSTGYYIKADPKTKYVIRIYSKDGNKRKK